MSAANKSESTPDTQPEQSSGGLASWFLPILIGAAIGTAFALWVLPALTTSAVDRIVRKWEWGAYEQNLALEEELVALGSAERPGVRKAFLDAEPQFPEWKFWIGTVLAQEPFLDTAALKDIVKDGAPWDARVAAAVLVEALEPESLNGDLRALVIPPLFDWVEDLSVLHHEIPLRALSRIELAPGAESERWKAALLDLLDTAKRGEPPEGEDVELATDRADAAIALGRLIPDAEVEAALWKPALDENEEQEPRVEAVRALRNELVFDDLEPWHKLAASENRMIRQMVSELGITGRARDPGLDAILAPLHRDPDPLVRAGSIESQTARLRPTMLPMFGELMEDHDAEVRGTAMRAAARFAVNPGGKERAAAILHRLATSDDDEELQAAICTMFKLTDEHPGFQAGEIVPEYGEVARPALDAFKSEPGTRNAAITAWMNASGAEERSDADRIDALEALKNHPDPKNRERAEAELARLKR